MARRGSPLHKLHRFTAEGLSVYYNHVLDFQNQAKERGVEEVVTETQVYLDEIKKEGEKRQLKVA